MRITKTASLTYEQAKFLEDHHISFTEIAQCLVDELMEEKKEKVLI